MNVMTLALSLTFVLEWFYNIFLQHSVVTTAGAEMEQLALRKMMSPDGIFFIHTPAVLYD
jgi:hypothetical protein